MKYKGKILRAMQSGVRIMEGIDSLNVCVAGSVVKSYLMMGYKLPSDEDIRFIVMSIVDILTDGYTGLFINEIPVCFEMGCLKRFGDRFILSVSTFVEWIDKYVDSVDRKAAILEYNSSKVALSMTTEEGKVKATKEVIERYYSTYCQSKGSLSFVSAHYMYDQLQSLGGIKNTKEEKLNAVNEARRIILEGKEPYLKYMSDLDEKKIAKLLLLCRLFDELMRRGVKSIF